MGRRLEYPVERFGGKKGSLTDAVAEAIILWVDTDGSAKTKKPKPSINQIDNGR